MTQSLSMVYFILFLLALSPAADSFSVPSANRIVAVMKSAAEAVNAIDGAIRAYRGCNVLLDPRLASSAEVINVIDQLVEAEVVRGMFVASSSLNASDLSAVLRSSSVWTAMMVGVERNSLDLTSHDSIDQLVVALNSMAVGIKFLLILEIDSTGDTTSLLEQSEMISAIEALGVRSFDTMIMPIQGSTSILCQSLDASSVVTNSLQECRRLRGRNLTVSYYGYAPYIVYPGKNDISREPRGSDVRVLKTLAKRLGFSYNLEKAINIDIVSENGTKRGMIWRVFTRQSALGLGPIVMMSSRFPYVDFGTYVAANRVRFASLKTQVARQFDNIITPLDPLVWTGTLLAIAAMVAAFSVANRVLRQGQSVVEAFMKVFGIIVYLGLPDPKAKMPRHTTLWVLEAVWLLTGFVLSASYRTTLWAMMTTVPFAPSIDTAQQVLDLGLPVMAVRSTVCDGALRDSNNRIYREIYQKLVLEMNGTYLLDDGVDPDWVVEKLQAGQIIESTFRDQSRQFHMSTEVLMTSLSSYVYPKSSWIGPEVDSVIQILIQAGIVNHEIEAFQFSLDLEDKMLNGGDDPGADNVDVETVLAPLNMMQIAAILMVLICGLGLSVVIAVAERAVFHVPTSVMPMLPLLSARKKRKKAEKPNPGDEVVSYMVEGEAPEMMTLERL